MKPLFSINHLSYSIGNRTLLEVNSLHLNSKDVIHLQGESGVGKSLFGLSLLGVFSAQGKVDYSFEINELNDIDWRSIRKNKIGYIFQQPKAYFNPVRTCGSQLEELFESDIPKEIRKKEILEWCARLNLSNPERIFHAYPHEFSVGQLQRIYVISALLRRPHLIVADEPFAHLDWPTAQLVARILIDYVNKNDAALLIISHEIMGKMFIPTRVWNFEKGTITSQNYSDFKVSFVATDPIPLQQRKSKNLDARPILQLRNVSKIYSSGFAFYKNQVKALKQINFDILPGSRIGLMGTSGSGKSTLASILTGLIEKTSGEVDGIPRTSFEIVNIWKRHASPVQLVFQDPFNSFNSAQSIKSQICNSSNYDRILYFMTEMGLNAFDLQRTPMALSGGELQRFSIIRALATDPSPRVLILDEALSAVDLATQESILSCIQAEFPDLSILFISHRYQRLDALCSEVYFMEKGELVYKLNAQGRNMESIPDHINQMIGY